MAWRSLPGWEEISPTGWPYLKICVHLKHIWVLVSSEYAPAFQDLGVFQNYL